jgi:hypothetical protein
MDGGATLMKIFADLHHADLYYSLKLLFEDRLGWELYRPIGYEWFHEGYWKIAEPYGNAMDTVGQYLDDTGIGEWDARLNSDYYKKDDIYYCWEPSHGYHQKAITFEKFKEMNFDVIMPTVALHDACYTELQRLFQPRAKVIAQMGNIHQTTNIPHVLYNVPYSPTAGQKAIYYHQEIDPNLYKYVPVDTTKKAIYSMVNLLPDAHYYHGLKEGLPEVDMKAWGSSCPDGALYGCKGVAEEMQNANMGLNSKTLIGFGHTVMGWFASGRPVITGMRKIRQYGLDLVNLFEPDVTCYDLDNGHDINGHCNNLRKMLEPEVNIKMCEQAHQRFNEVVNYGEEEAQIRKFLGEIL